MRDKTSAIKSSGSIGNIFKRSSPIFILLILVILLSILSENFFSFSNFFNILRQSAVIGIIAVGQCIIIISGGIDLSVGSNMAFVGCLIAVATTQWGIPPALAIAMGMGAGAAIGLFNGFVITKLRLQDFIATLGTMTTIKGLALLTTGGVPISGIPESLMVLGGGKAMGLPVSALVFAAVAVLGIVLLKHTLFGRNIYAIGGNKEAAKVSGIHVDRTKIGTNVVCGLCCGLAGVVMLGRLYSANALMGEGLELNSIAAVVLGGTSMKGGSGSIGGTIIGVITIGILNNGLDMLNVSAFWQSFILGLVIIGVVAFDTWRAEKLD